MVRRKQANSSRLLCRKLHLSGSGLPIPIIRLVDLYMREVLGRTRVLVVLNLLLATDEL